MKVGLVLEGGAMRGLFTAGVLDVMLENNIEVDAIVGVSAGALFGPNYFSRQRGRVLRYMSKYIKDKRYISYRNLVFTGNIVSKNFAYYKVQEELDRFDNEEFKKNNKEFLAVATNVNTGKSEYLEIKDAFKDMEKLRASSSVPLVSKMVEVEGKYYLDGAISNSIPVDRFIDEGFDKIIVVLTRPIDYKKEPLSNKKIRMINFRYRKYPKLVESMKKRYKVYNDTLERIKQLEEKGKVFVIRPKENINIKIVERDASKLKEAYDLGVNETEKVLGDLKNYLKKC